jgi:hypothetical protein
MRNYKVSYLHEDSSIRVKYIDAVNSESARALVYGNTLGCVQTLKADLVSDTPMLNGDMANEFNESFYSDML